MPVNAPFTGFYSAAMRDQLRCITDEELRVFFAVSLYSGPNGAARPGVRELHDATGYHTELVSQTLKTLQQKNLVMVLRQNERDPLTGQMLANVYVVNPDLVLVSDPSFWQQNRVRHASMPESTFPVKPAQAEQNRIRKQNQEVDTAKQTAIEGAAGLSPSPHMATRITPPANTVGHHHETQRTAGSANAPNSPTQSRTPPGSAVPPSRNLSFVDSLAVEAIRRQVVDMPHEKAAELVALYGIDRFTATVLAMKERAKKVTIKRPTGWIIRTLEKGAKKSA